MDPGPSSTAEVVARGLSRRQLLGAAVAAGGFGLVADTTSIVSASAPRAFPEALDDLIPGLGYVSLDAFAFDVAGTSPSSYRLYQDVTGMQPEPPSQHINAALPLPIGAVIRQVNIGYQGQPVVSIARRTLGGTLADLTPPVSLAAGGGPKTQSLTVDAELTQGATYSVRAFCSPGDSILGMTIGFVPARRAFVPFAGANPRVLDTRPDGRLDPEEEIVVDLSGHVAPGAQASVFNLTAVNTGGPGFLAVFPEGIAYPGNSSLNFIAAGQVVANGVVSPMTDDKIRVRTGPASSHVIIDAIGSLF